LLEKIHDLRADMTSRAETGSSATITSAQGERTGRYNALALASGELV